MEAWTCLSVIVEGRAHGCHHAELDAEGSTEHFGEWRQAVGLRVRQHSVYPVNSLYS